MAKAKPTASKAAMRRRAAKMAKGNGKRNGIGPVIKLTVEDRRWFENIMLKRDLVKRESEERLTVINKDAVELSTLISKREGVDIGEYELDWKALSAKPKPKEKKEEAEPQAEA